MITINDMVETIWRMIIVLVCLAVIGEVNKNNPNSMRFIAILGIYYVAIPMGKKLYSLYKLIKSAHNKPNVNKLRGKNND